MVRTARAKARRTANILGDKPITAVYFDGKKDDTCMKAKDDFDNEEESLDGNFMNI